MKRCCDRTLPEIAEYLGTGSYSTVRWNCRQIEAKVAREKKLRDLD
jgi:chromosomal replication initiation ATPase DnaA